MGNYKTEIKIGILKSNISFDELKEKVIDIDENFIEDKIYIKNIYGRELFAFKDIKIDDKKFNKKNDLFSEISEKLVIQRKVENKIVVLFKEIDIDNKKRIIFFSVGDSRSFIEDRYFENNGVMKTILNYISKNEIKCDFLACSLRESGTSNKVHYEKSIPVNDLSLIGFDRYSNSVRKIVAKCKIFEETNDNILQLGKFVKLSVENDASYFEKILRLFKEYLNKNEYQKKYSFIDDFKVIEEDDKNLIDKLNNKLIDRINWKSNENNDISLFWPDFLHADEYVFDYFSIKEKGRQIPLIDDEIKFLSIDLLEEMGIEKFDIEKLKDIYVHLIKDDGTSGKKKNLYEIIFYEVDLEGVKYFLDEGKWTIISEKLTTKVRNFPEDMEKQKYEISGHIIWDFKKHNNEGEFNDFLAKEMKGKLLDRKLIQLEKFDKLEIGDVLIYNDEKREIFAVKYLNSSSSISHLIEQVINSKQIIKDDPEEVNSFLKNVLKNENIDVNKIDKIILLIATPNKKESFEHFPFFSKMSLHNFFTRNDDSKIKYKISLIPTINYKDRIKKNKKNEKK